MTKRTPKKQARRAQLFAEAVAVLCPWCGEPQPEKGGSEMWTRSDFDYKSGIFPCVACDEPVLITVDPKAQFA
jgi:hypothetical protein